MNSSRNYRWLAATVVLVIVATLVLVGCGKEEEKVLSMYVAYGGPDVIAEEFEKATGIKIEYLTMSSGEVLARLQARRPTLRPTCGLVVAPTRSSRPQTRD